MLDFLDVYSVQIVAVLQACFCGGIAFVIAFKYKRADSSYQWLPSLCAFGLASLFAQQWLSLVGRILMYGEWPVVSIYNTLIFGILFILITRARGNVARMFEFNRRERNDSQD